MSGACRVVVMTRAPVPGETKRRLIQAIGAERAAALHRAMIRRAVATALQSGVGPVELWCTPGTDHEVLRSLRSRTQVELHVQVGTDLGERMHAAIAARPGATAVIGTDCPFLEPDDPLLTAGALHRGDADVVLVPAFDGGYVLIGVAGPRPELFARMDWGTERVLAQTRERARTARLRLLELAARRDIDRPEDLDALAGVLDW